MIVTFVRHGETDWNRDRRFQGQVDVPLNTRGKSQARSLARALRSQKFDRAVSSDLSRAVETARAICGRQRVDADPRWREFAFGEWEGLTWEQITQRWPDALHKSAAAARDYAPPGGETFVTVRQRVGRALDDLRRAGHANVLVVTHAGPLHAILHYVFSDPQAEQDEILGVRFIPASITQIQFDDSGAELLSLNDVSHL